MSISNNYNIDSLLKHFILIYILRNKKFKKFYKVINKILNMDNKLLLK